ncbi:MAG: YraN family protein [Lentisphaerae bacterium]|nr:YraN family protein [Lentisphaerota bacterium]
MLNIFKRKPFSHIQLGRKGEAAAVRLFKARNCVILARNWRNNNEHDGIGELDIVLLDGETLVFAEVKTRRKLDKYLPGTNLSDAQKKRICRGAHAYCRKHHVPESVEKRFDLVEVIHDERKIVDIALHEKYMTFSNPMSLNSQTNGDILNKVY